MKIFIDMDGVLAEWNSSAAFEDVCKPGYFISRPPMKGMCDVIRKLLKSDLGESVYVRSAVIPDDHSESEKRAWLNAHLPELEPERYEFVPYGTSKNEGLDFKSDKLFLVDDFSHNLHEWQGTGIKVYNGINGTHGTWRGYRIDSSMDPEQLFRQLYGIIKAELACA